MKPKTEDNTMKFLNKYTVITLISILFLLGCSEKKVVFKPVPNTPKQLVSSIEWINYKEPKPVKTIFDMFRESLSDTSSNSSGTSNSSSVKGSSCYSVKNENLRNACLANAFKQESNCFSIIDDENLRNHCLGVVKGTESNCFSITIDYEDSRNFCLGSVKKNQSYCFDIKSKDLKNACIATATRNKNYCYEVKNEDRKNVCLGGFD